MRTIAISNLKGGSGKTTTAVNLSAAFAQNGKSVLLIDADPQAHATLSLGVFKKNIKEDLYSLLIFGKNLKDVVVQTAIEQLKIIPSTRRLAYFERNYSHIQKARTILSTILTNIYGMFDYVVLDTPPNLTLMTLSALISSNEVYVPMQTHFLAMRGLVDIVRLLYKINQQYNPNLKLKGIIPTFFNKNTRVSKSILDEVRKNLGKNVLLHPIRNNIALAEAPRFGRSIFQYNAKSAGALDYLKVADQIENMK